MCNPHKIASILTGASIAIGAAIIIYGLVAAFGSSWWTSGVNVALMLAAAALMAVAIGAVAGAIVEADKCSSGACSGAGRNLRQMLAVLDTMLSTLLISGIAAALASGIPYAGVVIGAFFAASAIAAGILLIHISGGLLPGLLACLGTTSSAVTAQATVATVVGFMLFALAVAGGGFGIAAKGVPFPPI